MKISTKLSLGFGAMALLILILAAFSLMRISGIESVVESQNKTRTEMLDQLYNLVGIEVSLRAVFAHLVKSFQWGHRFFFLLQVSRRETVRLKMRRPSWLSGSRLTSESQSLPSAPRAADTSTEGSLVSPKL